MTLLLLVRAKRDLWKHRLIRVGASLQNLANLVCLAVIWSQSGFRGHGPPSDSAGRATTGSRRLALMANLTVARCGVSGSTIPSTSARVHWQSRTWLSIP